MWCEPIACVLWLKNGWLFKARNLFQLMQTNGNVTCTFCCEGCFHCGESACMAKDDIVKLKKKSRWYQYKIWTRVDSSIQWKNVSSLDNGKAMRPRTKFIFQIWFYFQNTLSGIMIYLCHSGLINPEITYFLDYLIQNYVFNFS